MKLTPKWHTGVLCATLLAASAMPGSAQITINQVSTSDWEINNGVLTVHWLPTGGRIFSIHWSAFPNQELIDQTNRDSHGAKGFYMDNAGNIGGATSPSFFLDPNGKYIDFWIAHQADTASPFSWSWHDVMFANDPGIHVYFVLDHGPGDLQGSVGQIQWVFRGDLTQFTNTYSVNSGLNNLGATAVPMPDAVLFGGTSSGRNVQDATVDLHGLTLPPGFRREFYTKYDYSSYEYLHQAQGVYGSSLGAWMVVPGPDSLTGGPTKQDLIFTGNLLIMEAFSNHLDNQINFTVPADAVAHRLYGPFYLHFNALNDAHPTPASLYGEALAAVNPFKPAYDNEAVLLGDGYVPSTDRGNVQVTVNGAGGLGLNQAWAVLSDQNTNFQYTHAGYEYWQNLNPAGVATFQNVVPGTYRLSVYVLGQWGELRLDGIDVRAHQPTQVGVNFTPESFGPAAPVWTIGTADRSSHEFLHGGIENPIDLDPNYVDELTNRLGNSVQDDREFWGNWNYWADFASTNGAVVYRATPVGSTPATNDLSKWNYNQWHVFDPGLFAGIFDSADQTTDGYKFICPAYVGNCATASVPDWQVHFTTTPGQQAQGRFVALSVGLADTESDLTVSLNGNPLVWPGVGLKNADADVRSGFSGTYQWIVFQWNTSQLNPPGQDNVITFNVNRTQGVMYDALRMEIANASAAHENAGLNDYEFVTSGVYEPANDALANQTATASQPPSPDFSLSAGPSSVSVAQGAAESSTITVAPTGGFTGTVSLSASGLPSGVTASFNPSSVTGESSTLTLNASSTAATGTSTITIGGASGSLSHGTTITLIVTSASGGTGGGVTFGPVATTSPYYNEEDVKLTNSAPLTALTVTIAIQRTTGITFNGEYNTVGSAITQSNNSASSTITYTFTLNPGQTLNPGTYTFAAQTSGTGTTHATSGDTFTVSYTTGGESFSQTRNF